MNEGREVLHAIERGFSLAASPWAESVCLGLCVPMSMPVCMSLLIYERNKNSHTEMCAATACSCLWVYAKHMEELRTGTREDRKRDRWITSDFYDTNIKKSQHPWAYVRRCPFATDWGILLKLFQRRASISSLMAAARLYSVPPTWAGSSIFTTIDFLSSPIWKNMAHMPGGDTATKLDYLTS